MHHCFPVDAFRAMSYCQLANLLLPMALAIFAQFQAIKPYELKTY